MMAAKWPLRVLRNVTSFVIFDEVQSNLLALTFIFSKLFFEKNYFPCFVNNIPEKLEFTCDFLNLFLLGKCWYYRCCATQATPTMQELRTSLACLPPNGSLNFNVSRVLTTGVQRDRDA